MAGRHSHCGLRTRMKMSWTDLNPGSRFLSCQKYGQAGACGFFVWHDPSMCERSRQIIPGLLKTMSTLQKQLREQKEREKAYCVVLVVCLMATLFLGLYGF